jgi:SnoaL-like domain
MNNTANADRLQELLDRQDIIDCIHRYCRAVDRLDRELLLSVYHSDAIDDHGPYVGTPEGFAEWAFADHRRNHVLTRHIVTNHSCEISGSSAHTETYWMFTAINREGPPTLHFGRYIDHFERRAGRWAIAARVCLIEHHALLAELPMPADAIAVLQSNGVASRDRSDLSYMRPLQVSRQPVNS